MRLRRLVTLRTAVGTLMTVPLRIPGGVHLKVMRLVRSLIFIPFVHLVALLFLIRRGRLSCWVRCLTASSHETLLRFPTMPRDQFPKVPYRRLSATIGRFRLHQFCRRFLKGWSLCVLVAFWRDLGSCHLTSIHTERVWVPVMLFWTSSMLVSWN